MYIYKGHLTTAFVIAPADKSVGAHSYWEEKRERGAMEDDDKRGSDEAVRIVACASR